MTTCNNELRKNGENYPRTCRRCGLGKCNHPDFAEQGGSPSLKTIAGLLQKLSYRDMNTLARMIAPEGSDALAQQLLCVADRILLEKLPK